MTDPQSQAPPRLLDDPSLDGILRQDLQIASTTAPLPYNVDAGLARFEQSVINGAAGAPSSAGAGLRVLGWVVGAAVLVGGGIGAGWMANMPSERVSDQASVVATAGSQHVQVEADVAAADVKPTDSAKTPVAPSEAELAPALDPQAEHDEQAHEPATVRPATKPADAEPVPSLADEAKQINAGRKLLASDPGKTLAIMQAAEKQFPNGAMIQERTGYTILALVGLNRRPEAEQVAQTYLQRWPNGPLAHRVRDALGL